MSATTAYSEADALRHCRHVARTRARNFYYGLKLLPEPHRSAMFAIYAWMRMADDLVDNAPGDPEQTQQRIEQFRHRTDETLAGRPPHDEPVWIALAHTVRTFSLEPAHLHQMLDGQLLDLGETQYETFDDLREYCYRVASTVGLVCIEVWGYTDPKAREHAIDRGIAYQLTNILRDFREDCGHGRVYLPAADFARHGITPEDLRNWSKPEPCAAFVREQAQRAVSFYDRSAPLDEMISPACRPTLWAMTEIYRGLLEKIIDEPSSVAGEARVRLSAMQKSMIAIRAKWRGTFAAVKAAEPVTRNGKQ